MSKSKLFWPFGACAYLLIIAAILGCLSGARSTSAQTPVTGPEWQPVPGAPADVDFRSVFMVGAVSGIAVGKQGHHGVAYDLEWIGQGNVRDLKLTPANFNFRSPLSAAVIVNQEAWAVG